MGKERNGGESGGPPVDARVARRRQDPIGRKLRKFYEDVVEESIPDEFLAILEDADVKQSDSDGGGTAGEDVTGAASDTRASMPER